MDWDLFAFGPTGWGDELLSGFAVTLALSLVAYGIGTAVGLGLAFVDLYGPAPLAILVRGSSAILRSVPELLLLFFVFFGLPIILMAGTEALGSRLRVEIGPFLAGVIALSAVQAAYACEVFKGALRAVPNGLAEAALSLGLGPVKSTLLVRLPVALRYAYPGLMTLWMSIIKATPLVSAIGLSDLLGQASTASENTKAYFAFYIAALLAYLVISGVSLFVQFRGERRLFRHLPAV